MSDTIKTDSNQYITRQKQKPTQEKLPTYFFLAEGSDFTYIPQGN